MRSNYRLLIGIIIFGFMCVAANTSAQEEPPSSIRIEEIDWQLYSHGVRIRYFMDVYQCAIYMDKSGENLHSILELKRPVAIRIKILISELPDQVPDAWKEAIQPEISDKLYRRFKKRIFKLEQGDTLTFTFLPRQSTNFYINDDKKFSDPGSSLMLALLEQWIGPIPISEDLKMALLKK